MRGCKALVNVQSGRGLRGNCGWKCTRRQNSEERKKERGETNFSVGRVILHWRTSQAVRESRADMVVAGAAAVVRLDHRAEHCSYHYSLYMSTLRE